jgi:hypothetical protein
MDIVAVAAVAAHQRIFVTTNPIPIILGHTVAAVLTTTPVDLGSITVLRVALVLSITVIFIADEQRTTTSNYTLMRTIQVRGKEAAVIVAHGYVLEALTFPTAHLLIPLLLEPHTHTVVLA